MVAETMNNPKTEEIAGELRWYADFYEGSTLGLHLHRAADRLEELEAELSRLKAQQRWIPVTERLPEDDDDVLICAVDGDGNTVRAMTSYTHRMYGYNIEGWCPPWQYFSNTYIITHWMMLPETPKEE